MTIDVFDHVPAVGFEARWRVVGKPAFNVTVDRDAVVIPESNQLTQAQRSSQ